LALNGLSDEQIKEAGWVVQSVAGASAYMYSTDYPVDKFKRELEQVVEYIKKQTK
jgi:predicted TIM-barrel fold metal-dependent hydrolase